MCKSGSLLYGGVLLLASEENVPLQLAQAASDTQTKLYGSLPCLSEVQHACNETDKLVLIFNNYHNKFSYITEQ